MNELRAVPSDVWQEIYQYQTPKEVIKFALSSKQNYDKVWADLRRYSMRQCGTGGKIDFVKCVSSEKCRAFCFNDEENFLNLVRHLPNLEGKQVSIQSAESPEEIHHGKIAAVNLTLGDISMTSTGTKQWEPTFHKTGVPT
jgi:hypothetical protein